MNNQEILDNAPEGAEFTSVMGYLWNDNEDWFIYDSTSEEWLHLFFHEHTYSDWNIRSLADIAKIAELEAIIRGRDELINNAVSSRIAELEKERKTLRAICEKADEITVNCTTTDSQAVDKLLDLFDKNRDFYMLETSRGR